MGQQKNQSPVKSKGHKEKVTPKDKIDPSKVSLFTHPIITLKVTVILLGKLILGTLNFIQKHIALIVALVGIIATFLYAPGPHQMVSTSNQYMKDINSICVVPTRCN